MKVKYIISAAILAIAAQVVFGAAYGESRLMAAGQPTTNSESDSIKPATKIVDSKTAKESSSTAVRQTRLQRRSGSMALADTSHLKKQRSAMNAIQDSIKVDSRDSLGSIPSDSIKVFANDSTAKKGGSFLEDIISGKNTDSLVYDVKNKLVYIYNEGDVTYQNMNLKADFMRVNMDTKEIYAYGKPDSVDGKLTSTHPVFTEGQTSYTMDTITYNISSKKAKIKGVATQEGDGWLVGGSIKKMADNTINIQHGKYTTCDHTDHPHFYLAMTKAKIIPGKKIITGPAYLVMEDVPIYFLGIPEGFFPINMGPKSGLLMPSFGEDSKGFFIRDLGYYFKLGDHADLALRGGIYTLGSWELSAASR